MDKKETPATQKPSSMAEDIRRETIGLYKLRKTSSLLSTVFFSALFAGSGMLLSYNHENLKEIESDPEAFTESYRDDCFNKQVEEIENNVLDDAELTKNISNAMKSDGRDTPSIFIQFNDNAELPSSMPEGTNVISVSAQEDKARTEQCMKERSETGHQIADVLHKSSIGLTLVFFLIAGFKAYQTKKYGQKIKDLEGKPPKPPML